MPKKACVTVRGNNGSNHGPMCAISINREVAWEIKTSLQCRFFTQFTETHLISYFALYPTKISIMYNSNMQKTSNMLRIKKKNEIICEFLARYLKIVYENFFDN
ncbi:hypothetical protein H311_00540 [Anncaliia algerae PRA109]|nr:hypothetical protein H311_00540 [Anncaliia algerae PRA109]